MPRTCDVRVLQQEMRAISRSSGVTFNRSSTWDLVKICAAELDESVLDASVELPGLWKPKIPRPTDELRIDSASAKASECSKMDIPVSVEAGLPCRAHDSVSTMWLRQIRIKTGHINENEPYGICPSTGLPIDTALQEYWSPSQNNREELRL